MNECSAAVRKSASCFLRIALAVAFSVEVSSDREGEWRSLGGGCVVAGNDHGTGIGWRTRGASQGDHKSRFVRNFNETRRRNIEESRA